MPEFFSVEALAALATLTVLEIVLGIDNIVFISILVGRLPPEQRARTRRLGLLLALGTRILLLLGISWVMGLTAPLFTLMDHEVSTRDLLLMGGGLFLIAKSVWEIHDKMEGDEHGATAGIAASAGFVIFQIAMIDIIFSLDSVITAIGMARDLWVMITAVLISIGVMMFFAGRIGDFVDRHPTMKILALAFLVLIGVLLLAEGVGAHLNRGYVYFAMAFAFAVELVNIRVRKSSPVQLHQTWVDRSPHGGAGFNPR